MHTVVGYVGGEGLAPVRDWFREHRLRENFDYIVVDRCYKDTWVQLVFEDAGYATLFKLAWGGNEPRNIEVMLGVDRQTVVFDHHGVMLPGQSDIHFTLMKNIPVPVVWEVHSMGHRPRSKPRIISPQGMNTYTMTAHEFDQYREGSSGVMVRTRVRTPNEGDIVDTVSVVVVRTR